MIHAAGILLLDKQGKVLLLQRGPVGDHVGEWCVPGGKIEEGETPLAAACRECEEECGYKCRPEDCTEFTHRIKDDVDFTTFIAQCDGAFKVDVHKSGGEVSGFAWADPKNPPRPLHPGCEIVLRRFSMNELDIAHAIRDQELTSPQKYENVWLFDMRITGTGLAYRARFEEFAWRDKSLYLTPEFLARCNGLPVILEHPEGNVLNTREYQQRNVGSVYVPYIKNEEVWGIVKIWDEPTAHLIMENRLSTSPAVVWRDPNANLQAEMETGQKFLIEGKPSLLDHLAICEQGVWDKGGVPVGISTNGNGVIAMADEVVKDKAAADSAATPTVDLGPLTKLLSTVSEQVLGLVTRMDSVEKKLEARKDDATPKNKIINDKAKADDDDDDKKGKDSKAKADDDDDDDKGKDSKAKADDDEEKPRKASDAKAKADDDDDKGKDSKARGDEFPPKKKEEKDDDAGDPKDLKADGKKRGDDDDDDKGKDSRGDSIVVSKKDWDEVMRRLPKVLTDEDLDAFSKAQSRADKVYSLFGESAQRPMHGESVLAYRRRLLKPLQKHSHIWKGANLNVVSVDDAAFNNAEDQILQAAVDAAKNPASVPLGQLREHIETRGGHTYHRFYGRPQSWMAPFAPGGRRVKRINQPNKGGHVDA